jgi:hypothetical protein
LLRFPGGWPTLNDFYVPHSNRGCPILAFFARVGGDAACAISLVTTRHGSTNLRRHSRLPPSTGSGQALTNNARMGHAGGKENALAARSTERAPFENRERCGSLSHILPTGKSKVGQPPKISFRNRVASLRRGRRSLYPPLQRTQGRGTHRAGGATKIKSVGHPAHQEVAEFVMDTRQWLA